MNQSRLMQDQVSKQKFISTNDKKIRKKTMLYATKVEDWWTLYLCESLQDDESNGLRS